MRKKKNQKSFRSLLSVLLIAAMLIGYFPASVLGAIGDVPEGKPVGSVQVSVEDVIPTPADKDWPAPRGVMLAPTVVDIYETDSAMDAVVRACNGAGLKVEGASKSYISDIDGLAEFGRGEQSGWMVTLNDWFTNEGISSFTVANGGLVDGDTLAVRYTLDFGSDIGSGWDNTNKTLTDLTVDKGILTPEFKGDINDYTLKLPEGTTGIKITPTAFNKNYQVRTYVGNTHYKRTQEIPVEHGTEILVKVGDPSWPSMNTGGGEAKIYKIKINSQNTIPNLREGVEASVTKKVGLDASLSLDLNSIFEDLDGDPLSFSVKINDGEYGYANPQYTYKPSENTMLVFKASDGKAESANTYTVNIVKTDNTAPLIKAGVAAVETIKKETNGNSYGYLYPKNYFDDPQGDELTYFVSVDSGEWTQMSGANPSQRVVETVGVYTYKFKAFDGEFFSPDKTVIYECIQKPNIQITPVAQPRVNTTSDTSNIQFIYDETKTNEIQLSTTITPPERAEAVTWSITGGASYASIDQNGKVTLTEACKDVSTYAYITVRATISGENNYSNRSIIVYPDGPQMKENEGTYTLRNDGKDEVAKSIAMVNTNYSGNVVITSSDESVATAVNASNNINITPKKPGKTTIKVAAGWCEDYYDEIEVTVKGVAVYPKNSEDSTLISLKKGEETSLQLQAFGETDTETFTWESADESIATVDKNGLVTALKAGSVKIRAISSRSGLLQTIDGAVVLNIQGEGVPYLEDFAITTNFAKFSEGGEVLSKNNDFFQRAKTDYELICDPTQTTASHFSWITKAVYDTEKYDLSVNYTDLTGSPVEDRVANNTAKTLNYILARDNPSVIRYKLTDKEDAENVTVYNFKVNTTTNETSTLSTSTNLYPNETGTTAPTIPTYEGKAEGTLFKVTEDGGLGTSGFAATTESYKAFVFDGTENITLKTNPTSVSERVQVVVDDKVAGELFYNIVSAPITLNTSGTTKIELKVVSSTTRDAQQAAGKDIFETPDKVYTINVEKVKATAADMVMTDVEIDKGEFVAPGYLQGAAANSAMIDYGIEEFILGFNVPADYEVYKDSAIPLNLQTGTTVGDKKHYDVEYAMTGATLTNQRIILKDPATSTSYTYSYSYYKKGNPEIIPSKVSEYLCLGSQYTANSPYATAPEKTLTGVTNTAGNTGGSILSLGNFGGHITYEFDQPIVNDPKNPAGVDFIVAGNSFGGAGASEPGAVEVSEDGVTWYQLAGSMHYDDEATWDYTMTYTNVGGASSWVASDGTSGTNYMYPLANRFPLFNWTAENKQSLTVSGLHLVSDASDPYGSASAAYPDFGYVDAQKNGNYGEASSPYLGSGVAKDGLMDLSWAVDSAGNPVEIDSAKFVRVSTASNIYAGAIGEKSTEVQFVTKTMNKSEAPVGVSNAPAKITVDGKEIALQSGVSQYEALVKDDFAVGVEASENANVYINSERCTEKEFTAIPKHGMIRIIVQEEEKEPQIYYLELVDSSFEEVEALIKALPPVAEMTLDDKIDVEAARTAYTELSEDQQRRIDPEVLTLLEAAEAKITELQAIADQEKADQEAADAVTQRINSLGEISSVEQKSQVEAARAAYDALTAGQKALVNEAVVEKLSAAEDKILELQAKVVEEIISALPQKSAEELSAQDKAAVLNALDAYDALAADIKAKVDEGAKAKLDAAKANLRAANHQAGDHGVTIADDGTLEDHIAIVVEDHDEETLAALKEALAGGKIDVEDMILSYNISLCNLRDGSEHQLAEGQGLTVTIDAGQDLTAVADRIRLAHHLADGTIEFIKPLKVEGQLVAFEATSFSPYSLVTLAQETTDPGTDPTNPTNPGGSSQGQGGSAGTSSGSATKTGDQTNLPLYFLLLALSGVALVVLKRKSNA